VKVVYLTESMDTSYGGPPTTIPEMVHALGQLSVDAEIVSVHDAQKQEENELIRQYALKHRSCRTSFPRAIKHSRDLSNLAKELVIRNSSCPQIFHINNLWNWPPYYLSRLAKKNSIPYVVSTRGMLLKAAREKSKAVKTIAWRLFFESVIRSASCVHATSSQELDELRMANIDSPVALIPHGIKQFELVSDEARQASKRQLNLDPTSDYALFLARITEHKGLHLLIEALGSLDRRVPNMKLLAAGNFSSNSYRTHIMSMIKKRGLSDRINLLGEVKGQRKDAAYRAAMMFVLPSRSENFGASIGEALSFGLPVVTTIDTPWARLQLESIGHIVDRTPDKIADAIHDISTWHAAQHLHVRQTAAVILDEYRWSERAKSMKSVYEWLTGYAGIPDCVDIVEPR
jgi:glycosyltransferase involved in cell wall biosynthesis